MVRVRAKMVGFGHVSGVLFAALSFQVAGVTCKNHWIKASATFYGDTNGGGTMGKFLEHIPYCEIYCSDKIFW